MIIETGIPRKKKYFSLLTLADDSGNCFFDEKLLLVAKSSGPANQRKFDVKLVNLDTFVGNEDKIDSLYQDPAIRETYIVSRINEYLIVLGKGYSILSKLSGKLLFSESQKNLPTSWSRDSVVRFTVVDDKYFRQIDLDEPQKGVDIYCLVENRVIDHLDVDFLFFNAFINDSDRLAGKRENGNFAVFSVSKKKWLYELDSNEVFNYAPSKHANFRGVSTEDKIVICNHLSLVVIDSASYEVLCHINCLKNEAMQKFIFENKVREINLGIIETRLVGDYLIVSGGTQRSYVIAVNITNGQVLWINFGFRKAPIAYIGGDLVFSTFEDRPVAWDLYTGEKVWESSSKSYATQVCMDGQWVVYSGYTGDFQCYKWNKPYLSPDRP